MYKSDKDLDTKEIEEMLFEKPDYTLHDEDVYVVTSQEEARQFAEKIYSENQHAFEKFGITWEILKSFKNNITAEGIYLNRLSDIPVKVDKEEL